MSVPRLESVVTKIFHCSRYYIGDEGKTTRMTTHGNIGEFNRAKEDWVSYCERMQQYFMANDIALRNKVETELNRLKQEGIIEPIRFSEWAAPIVLVVKRDGSIRICGDYKVTINKAAKVDSYPLPHIEDLFATLGKGKTYTKLDLAHAYQQIELDDKSKELATINTQKGLYRYCRLPFGVSSAPAIFQRTIEDILHSIPNVAVYIDDILVTGSS